MDRRDSTAEVHGLLARHIEIFECPACRGSLRIVDDERIQCSACRRPFAAQGGIPLLFWPAEWTGKDVTEIVKAFYEDTPFPNYDDMDSPESLREKAERGLFAKLLNEQIPHGARVLECGCGTGQLSNFLGLTWGRAVFGTDLCLNSLTLGHAFKDRHRIANVSFLQMNLFRPVFRPESFDVVISNGVLHHTADPFRGYQSILGCLKKGGYIIVGLYNSYARLTTDLRRMIFRVTGDRFRFLDRRLADANLNAARKRAWFRDQYKHPHESKHSFGEVLQWFDRSGVEFVNSIPKCMPGHALEADEHLFDPRSCGTGLDRLAVQFGMLVRGGREGGFFTMIGRKRA